MLEQRNPEPGRAHDPYDLHSYRTPIVMGTGSVSVPGEMPYYASGQYKGLLAGLRGAAEYELLTGYPGSAILGMDAQSAAHFLVIALIAIGNIGFFRPGKEGEFRR